MKAVSTFRVILIVLVLAILILAITVFSRYRRDMELSRTRLENIESKVLNTNSGNIEYATHGSGYPVLVVHGIFGGHDQGLILAKGQIGEQYLSIVPSRFGYLRSPLPQQATPGLQTDAFADLLDEMGFEQAAVMATSAGGTAAIQFALRYPDRCSALVLVSSNAPGEVEVGLPPKPRAKVMFQSDFIFWMLTSYFPSTMYSIMGVPGDFPMEAVFEREMDDVMATLMPVKERAEGAFFDMYTSNPAINSYPVNKISAPNLIRAC